MSNHPNAACSVGEQMGLGRCRGSPFCTCSAHSKEPVPGAAGGARSASRSAGGSPLRSRSQAQGSDNSGDSVHSSSNTLSRQSSPVESDSEIPDFVHETDWTGINEVRIPKCEHGRPAIMKRAWEGKHTGRRFFGCPLEKATEQCQFKDWIDEEHPERMQDTLVKLWRELRLTRRCSDTTNDALIDALRYNDIANYARSKLLDELASTKRDARKVIEVYHRKAAMVAADKSRMMWLVFCMLGVVVFLVAALVYKN